MATFKAVVRDYKKQDGKRNVRIRITHDSKVVYLPTNIFVDSNDITRAKLTIKSGTIIFTQCANMIQQCYDYCNTLGFAINNMTIEELAERVKLKLQGGEVFHLDFIEFANESIKTMSPGNAKNYRIMVNSVKRYINRDILDIGEITTDFLNGYKSYLIAEPTQRGRVHSKDVNKLVSKTKGSRAVSLYLSYIRAVHNLAKKQYNKESLGVINIPYSPFAEFDISQPRAKKRAIAVEKIQQIIDLPDAKSIELKCSKFRRADLARDCFLMSFALAGMNSVDLYTCSPAIDGVIVYNRTKTCLRREDAAEFHIKIPACIKDIIAKYRDPSNVRMFCFYNHYKDKDSFNDAINTGLDDVATSIGFDDLTFYAARHSWATIARSSAVGIEKATVHEALNHSNPEMKITDIYITRDWSVIWNANDKVLALFDWSALTVNK